MLHFDIDQGQMQQLVIDLQASEKQVRYALTRALSRTATTLRTLAARQLFSDLELRLVAMLRKRMKSLKVRAASGDSFSLWFGLNGIPVSWFKGTPSEGGAGAEFRGKQFPGAFVARSKFAGRKTILKRKGTKALHIEEQLLPISDKAQVTIEDRIFVKTEEIFWNHFERDLRARVKFRLGDA